MDGAPRDAILFGGGEAGFAGGFGRARPGWAEPS